MNQRALRLLAAIPVAVLSIAFFSLYWNRFEAPSSAGTFFYLGDLIVQGKLPYRETLMVATPLSAFKAAALIRLFGDTVAVGRLDGVLERTILALILFFLLSRYCRAGSAMLASFLTVVILSSDDADAIVNYHIDSVFWAVAAAGCASFCAGRASSRVRIAGALSAGFCSALSLLSKQTTGLGVVAAIAVVGFLLAWRSGGAQSSFRFLASFLSGWAVPMALFLIWLNRTGSLTPFVHSVFTTSTSKGSLLTVLARPVLQTPWLFLASVIGTPLLAWLVRRTPRGDKAESWQNVAALAAGGALALAIAAVSVYSGRWWPGSAPSAAGPSTMLALSENLTIMAAVTGSAFLFFHCGWRYLQGTMTERDEQIWLLSAVSFAVAYMLSLSWAVYSPMAAPGVALLAGLALDRFEGADRKRFAVLASVVLLLISCAVSGKLTRPFKWMYWTEPPVNEAKFPSTLPKLAGLRLSEPTLTLTEKITRLVQEHTKPGDSLLVYPYFPIFYVLTGLNPSTYTFNHYIDVCPDAICRQDAATLRAQPPDAIIYLFETEEDLQRDEAIFRSGRKSGSREVARAIQDLAPGYHKLLSDTIPGSSRIIEVYTRR